MVGIQSRMPCGSPGMPIVSSPMRNCSWPRMKDAPCGAALLPIGIGENRALGGDTIDVGRAITHRAHGVGAVLRNADVVAEDDEDVRRLAGACRRLLLSLRAAHGPFAAAAAARSLPPRRRLRRSMEMDSCALLRFSACGRPMLHSSIKFVRPKPCGFARFGARQNYRPTHPARKVGPRGNTTAVPPPF